MRTGLRAEEVADMTARQLAGVDAGSWFNRAVPSRAREEYVRERVPTLDQVFRFFQDSAQASANLGGRLYIEMKTNAGEDFVKLTETVAQSVGEYGLNLRVVALSFELAAIAQIKKIDSSIRTGALFQPRRTRTRLFRKQEMISAAIDSGADEILLHRLIVTRGAVRLARENNLSVVVWTVDDPKWRVRAREMGIHALVTNNPGKMVGPIRRESVTS
jgi:glycerophosphoryl diester phosphodiesterase